MRTKTALNMEKTVQMQGRIQGEGAGGAHPLP